MKRVLVKLSGEALLGPRAQADKIDADFVCSLVEQLAIIIGSGVEIAVVVGGGNICRGRELSSIGITKVASDKVGMLATLMNALLVKDLIEQASLKSRIMSALPISGVVDAYASDHASQYLSQGDILVLAGGLGGPLFTTDTAACVRAIELNADCVIKCTMVNGVFDADPKLNTNAKQIPVVTYQHVIEKNLAVMDMTALTLAKENQLPIYVCDIFAKDVLVNLIVNKEKLGTVIKER